MENDKTFIIIITFEISDDCQWPRPSGSGLCADQTDGHLPLWGIN